MQNYPVWSWVSGKNTLTRTDYPINFVFVARLLQHALVYINTLMIQQILAEPDWQNRLQAEDLRALTPLIYAHVNPYGRFYLDMDERLPLED
jgi:hypothetical protein